MDLRRLDVCEPPPHDEPALKLMQMYPGDHLPHGPGWPSRLVPVVIGTATRKLCALVSGT
jgi:hypothetical protein